MPRKPDPIADAIAKTEPRPKNRLKVERILEAWAAGTADEQRQATRVEELLRHDDRETWSSARVARIIDHLGPECSEKAVAAWRRRHAHRGGAQ